MSVEHVERFYALFFAGLGLSLVGAVNALGRLPDRGRALAAVLVGGAAVGGLWLWSPNPSAVGLAAAVVAVGTVACLLAGSAWLAAAAARPAVRWGLLGVAGLACTVGSGVNFEAEDTRYIEAGMREYDIPPGRLDPVDDGGRVRTDRGTDVPLKRVNEARPVEEILAAERRMLDRSPHRDALVRRSAADEGTNCHGWVFAAGRFWVGGAHVPTILAENGYTEASDPRPGDVVVYREGGTVTHTAVVRYVTPGQPVLVEGKWGWLGVYLHPVERSAYGADFTYYRSPRPGHTLAGLDGEPAPAQIPSE